MWSTYVWMLGMPGPTELVVILLILLLLFGAKRLPEIARSLGEAIRGFKKTMTGNPDNPEKQNKEK